MRGRRARTAALQVRPSELSVGDQVSPKLGHTGVVRAPGQIASVVLHQDAHLWNWVVLQEGPTGSRRCCPVRVSCRPVRLVRARIGQL